MILCFSVKQVGQGRVSSSCMWAITWPPLQWVVEVHSSRHCLFRPSVVELCRVFQQLDESSEAMAKLQTVEVAVLRALVILAGGQECVTVALCRLSGLSRPSGVQSIPGFLSEQSTTSLVWLPGMAMSF